MSLSLQEKRRRFPPIACRLLARRTLAGKNVIALTDEEIAARGRLPIWWVKGLSWKLDWLGIPVEIEDAYRTGCGIDFDDSRSLERNWALWDKIGAGSHLRRSPLWPAHFVPLVREAEKLNRA